MSVIQAIVLGAVQGLTEFIPISSSGHLVVVPELFGWEAPGLSFDVMLHLGSLLALLVYFSGDLLDMAKGTIAGDRSARRMVALLAIGTIPAVVAALAFGDFFEDQFEDPAGAALQLLITAAILVAAELVLARHIRRAARTGGQLLTVADLRPGHAFAVGIAQAIAIIPGISRSGSTIGVGLALGLKREAAARFAFLLAIPALIGASILEIPELSSRDVGLGAGTAGLVASTITSYVAIAALIKFLRNNNLYPFALYCLIAGPVLYLLLR